MTKKLAYNIDERPKFGKLLIFAFQQLLAILAATIAVPSAVMGNLAKLGIEGFELSQSAALFGAGVGTLVYLLLTKFKSPVFVGSSFSFIPPMTAALAGAYSMTAGYLGLIIGAAFAALVYVILAIIVKISGVKWINKIMPPVVIGPTVAIIGLSLAGTAIGEAVDFTTNNGSAYVMDLHAVLCLICAIVTLITVCFCSVFGKKMTRLIPFIIGIIAGYILATIFTVIGTLTANDAMILVDFSKFANMEWIPDFTFLKAFSGGLDLGDGKFITYLGTLAFAYVPVTFVVFCEHLADHKNLSSIIGIDLLENPGLNRTLLGDGLGSFAGAIFGACPNTTYGESIACVAITGNASVVTIVATAVIAMVISFFGPFVTFLSTIPNCVMGGVCITLYGFIAVSGLKMIQFVDLNQNGNLFVVSAILIAGVGKLALSFGAITISDIACALILGIILNALFNKPAASAKTEEK